MAHVSRRLRLVMLGVAGLSAMYLLYEGRMVLIPFVLGALITYLLQPGVEALARRGVPRTPAILLLYALVVLAGATLLTVVVPTVTRELTQLLEVLPAQGAYFQRTITRAYQALPWRQVPIPIRDAVQDGLARGQEVASEWARGAARGLISFFTHILDFVLAPVVAFYLTKDLEVISRNFRTLLPARYRHDLLQALREMDVVLGGYIRGQLIIMGIIALLVCIGLTALRVPFSLLLGLVAGLTNIIPYFGPLIGAAPAMAVALIASPWRALYVGLLFMLVHELESGLISPRILGGSVGLHPLVVIAAILVGEQLWGAVGLVVAVPVAALLKVAVGTAWRMLLSAPPR